MSGPSDIPSPSRRRGSLAEFLGAGYPAVNSSPSSSLSGSVPTDLASGTQRRPSISVALGLSGDNPNSAYSAFSRTRRASMSTSGGSPDFRNSFDETAIGEEDDRAGPLQSPPSPSFARRLSFGAQAMREVRVGTSPTATTTTNNNAGRRPSSALFTLTEDDNHPGQLKGRSPESAKTGGEGFNWTESMRTRKPSATGGNPFMNSHARNRSMNMSAASPIEAATAPPKDMPKASPGPAIGAKIKKPDHLGERMLRGDFMMD